MSPELRKPVRCPILTDLRQTQQDIAHAARRLHQNLAHCQRCPAPCSAHRFVIEQINTALAETIQELNLARH